MLTSKVYLVIKWNTIPSSKMTYSLSTTVWALASHILVYIALQVFESTSTITKHSLIHETLNPGNDDYIFTKPNFATLAEDAYNVC